MNPVYFETARAVNALSSPSPARRVMEADGAVSRERKGRGGGFPRQRQPVHRLEIGDARIAPPFRLALLDPEQLGRLRVAPWIDRIDKACPTHAKVGGFRDALVVGGDERLPERPAGMHPVGPRQVMEPEQEAVRSRRRIAPCLGER